MASEIPVTNLNGSDPVTLVETLTDAIRALAVASERVAQTAPHGRDYQLNQPGDYQLAVEQHMARLATLREVNAGLVDLREAIIKQPLYARRMARQQQVAK